MGSAWFVHGGYLLNLWKAARCPGNLDYLKLREELERRYTPDNPIDEAYFLISELNIEGPGGAAFYRALSYPPPKGPGFRTKVYEPRVKQIRWPQGMGGQPVLHPVSQVPYKQVDHKPLQIGLAFHLMRSFMHRRWTNLFLGLGDGDYWEVVQYLVEQANVSLYLLGTLDSISDDMRAYARDIYDIVQEAPAINMVGRRVPERS